MASIARLCVALTTSFRNRATLSYASIVAFISRVDGLSEDINKMGETMQKVPSTDKEQKPMEQLRQNYWTTASDTGDLKDKISIVQDAVRYEISGHVVVDLAVLLWNAWHFLSTYAMLMEASSQHAVVSHFVEEGKPTWELLLDAFTSWSTISDIEREQAKSRILLEQVRIERNLHKIEKKCLQLQEQTKWKTLLLVVNSLLLMTGVPAYTSTWGLISTSVQVGAGTSMVGLSLASVAHLFQLVQIQKYLKELNTTSELLQQYISRCEAIHGIKI